MYLHFVCTSTSSSSNVVLLLAFSSTSLLHMLASHVKHEDWQTCWKIFYVHCFRPFSKKTKQKGKAPPIRLSRFTFRSCVFLFGLFSFSVNVSLLRHLPCWPYLAWIKNLHVLLHVHLFIPFLISSSLCHFPVLHVHTPLFCACSRDAEDMTLGTLAGTYSMCIVSGPFQEGTITKKKVPAISVHSYYAPFLSLFLIVSCFSCFSCSPPAR